MGEVMPPAGIGESEIDFFGYCCMGAAATRSRRASLASSGVASARSRAAVEMNLAGLNPARRAAAVMRRLAAEVRRMVVVCVAAMRHRCITYKTVSRLTVAGVT